MYVRQARSLRLGRVTWLPPLFGTLAEQQCTDRMYICTYQLELWLLHTLPQLTPATPWVFPCQETT